MQYNKAILVCVVLLYDLTNGQPMRRLNIRSINGVFEFNDRYLQEEIPQGGQMIQDQREIKRKQGACGVVNHPEGSAGINNQHTCPRRGRNGGVDGEGLVLHFLYRKYKVAHGV